VNEESSKNIKKSKIEKKRSKAKRREEKRSGVEKRNLFWVWPHACTQSFHCLSNLALPSSTVPDKLVMQYLYPFLLKVTAHILFLTTL
jgi:hypothetical protein